MTDTPTTVQQHIAQGAKYEEAVSHQQQDAEPSSSNSTTDPADATDKKNDDTEMYANGMHPMLRYCKPYWWPYRTFVKQRWIGRQLLEVVCTEFRDRSVDYYRHALECGVTRVNGVTAYPEYVLRDSDRIDNTVHRHEPPVSNDPVLVLHMDKEREFVVVAKPGSMPIHAAGRYFKHTLLEILKSDYGIKAFAVNRLDRLTSGLMILALSGPASAKLAGEFQNGKVGKEYIARVRGKFPEGEVVVDQPLLTVDRQMGLVIVAPEGKESKTIFTRMSYDEKRDQSVLHCRPLTGRTHQIRVHLQYLGHPIANDPLYSHEAVWGPDCGRGGVELVKQNEGQSSQEAALAERQMHGNESNKLRAIPDDSARMAGNEAIPETGSTMRVDPERLKEREFDNIDLTSPILLSKQARQVIGKLRRMRDEAEDWVKWKEVVWTAKAAQDKLDAIEDAAAEAAAAAKPVHPKARPKIPHPRVNHGRTRDKAVERDILEAPPNPLTPPVHVPEGFCNECYIPVPDDPDPETLFIYLHALRYTTERLGTWETPLPRWAGKEWDGDWRGWDGQPPVTALNYAEGEVEDAPAAAEPGTEDKIDLAAKLEQAKLDDQPVEEDVELPAK